MKALRQIGCSVWSTHQVGKGFPDLIWARNGITGLIEVKDGGKAPSARALTEDELKFKQDWRGLVHVALTPQDAVQHVLNQM